MRVEQALSAQMPRGTYAKFNADAMIRTDLLTRYQAHEIALRTGLETLDEGRLLEDKAPLTDAEKSAWLAAYKPTLQPPKPDAARSRADDEGRVMTKTLERRYTTAGFEYRASGDRTPGTMRGYALKWDRLSQNLGGFVERVAPVR